MPTDSEKVLSVLLLCLLGIVAVVWLLGRVTDTSDSSCPRAFRCEAVNGYCARCHQGFYP